MVLRRIVDLSGTRIRKYRVDNHYSQRDLANLFGVSVRTIVRWEQNATKPSSEEAQRIAAIMGIPADELVNDETYTDSFKSKEEDQSVLDRISDSVDNLVTGQESINESLITSRDEGNKRKDELISELRSQNEILLSRIEEYKKVLENRREDLYHKRIRTIAVVVTCIILLGLAIGTWMYWRNHGLNDEVKKGTDIMDQPSYFEIDDKE